MPGKSGSSTSGVIRQGPIMFEGKALGMKSFKSRFLVVNRNGIAYVYESAKKKKEKATFHLEGGEEVEAKQTKAKGNAYGFVVIDDKRDWVFACPDQATRDKWMSAIQSVLKQLGAINSLGQVLASADMKTIPGQLEFARTMASCGQIPKARRAYSKLIVDHGDHDTVHKAYEQFLMKYTKQPKQAEDNFVRRLRFLCVPKDLLKTRRGAELLKMSQKISFLSMQSDKGDFQQLETRPTSAMEAENVIKINRYRLPKASGLFKGRLTSEEEWPYQLLKINAGKLKKARGIVELWHQKQGETGMKVEYSYKDIEEKCWKLMNDCIKDAKGVGKLSVRLDVVSGRAKTRLSSVVEEKVDEQEEDSFEKRDRADRAERKRRETEIEAINSGELVAVGLDDVSDSREDSFGGQVDGILGDMDDILDDLDADDYDIDSDDGYGLDDYKSTDMGVGSSRVSGFGRSKGGKGGSTMDVDNDLDDILGDFNGNGKSKGGSKKGGGHDGGAGIGFNRYASGFGASMDASDTSMAGVKDDMELTFFQKVNAHLNDTSHHIMPWTAFILIWIVRRDKMEHIVSDVDNEKQIRTVFEFIYLFARGCFQHWSEDVCNQLQVLLGTLFHIPDNKRDPDEVKYKLCLQAITVLGDARINYKDKMATFDFIQSQKWLEALTQRRHKLAADSMLSKGLKAEFRNYYLQMDAVYEKNLFGHRFYPKICLITEEKYVSQSITRQDHDKVQGRCTWGPRKMNSYDKNAFSLVCNHRGIRPMTAATSELIQDFDMVYLLFCQSISDKLRPQLLIQLKALFRKFKIKIHEKEPGFAKHNARLTRDLAKYGSPKAARILDYCSITLTFETVKQLVQAFLLIDKTYKICRISNQLRDSTFVKSNVRFLFVYILAQHKDNRFVKMICEIRMTLNAIWDAESNRLDLKKQYAAILGDETTAKCQKEVFSKLGEGKKAFIRAQRDAQKAEQGLG